MQYVSYSGGGNPCNPSGVYADNALNRRLNRVGKPYKSAGRGCSSTGKYARGAKKGTPYLSVHHHGKRTTKSTGRRRAVAPATRPKSYKATAVRQQTKPKPVSPVVSPRKASPVITKSVAPKREIDYDIENLFGICDKLMINGIRIAEANVDVNSIIRKYNLDTSRLRYGTAKEDIINNCVDLDEQLRALRENIN